MPILTEFIWNPWVIGILVVLGLLYILIQVVESGGIPHEEAIEKELYRYVRKQYLMNKSEHDFYKVLLAAVGDRYYVFAQVHLSTIIDPAGAGQSYQGALNHINRKSVDFVLCDKQYLSPKLAIELDGNSHERVDRVARDVEVERMLQDARLPLLRVANDGNFNVIDVAEKIKVALGETISRNG